MRRLLTATTALGVLISPQRPLRAPRVGATSIAEARLEVLRKAKIDGLNRSFDDGMTQARSNAGRKS